MHYSELILLVLLQVCIYYVFENKFVRFILKIKLVDKPGKNKIHSNNVPLTGGPLVFLSIIIYFIFNYLNILDKSILNETIIIFVIGITFAFFVGIVDDILHINPQKKLFIITFFNILLFQNVAFFQTNILIFQNNFFTLELSIASLALIFSILSFLAYHYSLSILDGINGILGTYSVCFLIILLLFFEMKNELYNFIFYLILFLSFVTLLNFKNKLFFGNSGSLMLAALFPYLILYLNNQRDNSIYSLSYLSLVAIPILDMIRLFYIRITSRKSPFSKDLNHFHHLLFKRYQLFFTILIYISLSFLPFIFIQVLNLDALIALIIQFICFFSGTYYLSRKNN